MAEQRVTVTVKKHFGWYAAIFAGKIRSTWLFEKVCRLPAYTIIVNDDTTKAVTHNVEYLFK